MAAIAAQGFADKNETIDWLREQGLPFARASWLERIHSNGGKPIYAALRRRASPSEQRRSEPSSRRACHSRAPAPQRPSPAGRRRREPPRPIATHWRS